MTTNTTRYGFDLSTQTTAESRPNNQNPSGDQFADLAPGIATIEEPFPDTHSLNHHIENPDGTHQYQFTTIGLIDPSGRPVTTQNP